MDNVVAHRVPRKRMPREKALTGVCPGLGVRAGQPCNGFVYHLLLCYR